MEIEILHSFCFPNVIPKQYDRIHELKSVPVIFVLDLFYYCDYIIDF